MELQNLSSNWRKLQRTLKKPDSAKPPRQQQTLQPKRSVVNTQSSSARHDGVKRRKIQASPATSLVKNNYNRKTVHPRVEKQPQRAVKRRKVSSTMEADGVDGESVLSAGDGVKLQAEGFSLEQVTATAERVNEGLSATAEAGKYIAIDCEMVGVGPNPDNDSALARVSIVNYNGDQVYDSFVQPKETVTDWRTYVSGVSEEDMAHARSFEEVQRDLSKLLDGRILIGHAVRNDLDVLLLGHPKRDIRDTSKHPAYRKLAGGGSPRLKVLAAELLGLEIQGAAHSSLEDARATMLLFRRDKEAFDREHAKKWPPPRTPEKNDGNGNGNGNKKKKKKKKKN